MVYLSFICCKIEWLSSGCFDTDLSRALSFELLKTIYVIIFLHKFSLYKILADCV